MTPEIHARMQELRADAKFMADIAEVPREDIPQMCRDWAKWARRVDTPYARLLAAAAIRLTLEPEAFDPAFASEGNA